jgi:hypothetical protein
MIFYKAIDRINHQQIGELIKNGKEKCSKMMAKIVKEQKEKLIKSREFIEHAVKITKAERTKEG